MPETKNTPDLRAGDTVKLHNEVGWRTLSQDPAPVQSLWMLVDTKGQHYLARNESHEVRNA